MKLTPLEVRKQTFRKTMRGFDPEEVRIFLDMVADEYERVLQENGMLSEKVRYLSERLEEYHNLEKTLQNSILTAERIASESREQSRSEAESIINDAHVRSERILEDSRSRLRLLGEQIHHLSRQKELFIQRFNDLLEGQIQFLGTHRDDLKAIDELDARAESLVAEMTPVEDEPRGAVPSGVAPAGSDRVHPQRMDDEPIDAAPMEAEPMRVEPMQAEPAPAEPVRAEQLRTEPVRAESRSADVHPVERGAEPSAEEGQREMQHEPQHGPRHEVRTRESGQGPGQDPDLSRPRRDPAAYHEPRRRERGDGDDEGDDGGFFRPEERAEGFFEINAEEGARK